MAFIFIKVRTLRYFEKRAQVVRKKLKTPIKMLVNWFCRNIALMSLWWIDRIFVIKFYSICWKTSTLTKYVFWQFKFIFLDLKNIYLIQSIHGVLPPTSRIVSKKTDGASSVKRFTIVDSQESFILMADSVTEVEAKIERKIEAKEPIQPFLIVVLKNNAPEQFLVYFDSIYYTFLSFLAALDCCFKIYHVFNLKYAAASKNVWLFVELFFYKMCNKDCTGNIKVVVGEINKM